MPIGTNNWGEETYKNDTSHDVLDLNSVPQKKKKGNISFSIQRLSKKPEINE
jgi:hypothetical protein